MTALPDRDPSISTTFFGYNTTNIGDFQSLMDFVNGALTHK